MPYVTISIETSGNARPPTQNNTQKDFDLQQRRESPKSRYGFFRWPVLSRPLYFIRLITLLWVMLDTDCTQLRNIAFQYCSFFFWLNSPHWAMASSFMRFRVHTQQRTTVSRTLLDEWSACRRDLYVTAHNTHNRQTSMPPVRFEPAIPADERPQTYALDREVTGTGNSVMLLPTV